MGDVLYCNDPGCGAQLVSKAWLTTCKHLFCMKHGMEHFHNNWPQTSCPVCDESLVREKEVEIRSFNAKKLCLAGLRPERILSQLEFSMKLWEGQLDSQRTLDAVKIQKLTRLVEETEEKFKRIMHDREADLNCQIETLQSKYRSLASKLRQKVQELETAKMALRDWREATKGDRRYSHASSRHSASTSSLLNVDFLGLVPPESEIFTFDADLH